MGSLKSLHQQRGLEAGGLPAQLAGGAIQANPVVTLGVRRRNGDRPMPTRTLLRFTLLAGLAIPLCAFALGIGPLNVRSALNQNFEADIPLIVNNPSELKGLTVRIPRQQEFDQTGIERLAFFSKLRFTVETPPGGPNVIKIRSIEPIREPNFNLLLEVLWSRGRLMRDFPVQVDPQFYSNRREPPPLPLPTLPLDAVVAAPAPAVAPRPAVNLPPAPPVSLEGASSYGPVRSGETLMGIANRVRPATVDLPQMMSILVANNPGAFANGDPHNLRRGAVLKVPTAQALGDQAPAPTALADASTIPPVSVPSTLDTSAPPSSTTTSPTISPEPTSTVTTPAVAPPPTPPLTVPPVAATPPTAPVITPSPVTTPAVPAAPASNPPTAPVSTTISTPPSATSDPSTNTALATPPVTTSPTGQPAEIIPQASIPQTETTPPAASTALGTPPSPVPTQTPPAPVPAAEATPKPGSPTPPPKPPVQPVVETEPSFLENPMVWLAIALILAAIMAIVLLPLLRRSARAKASEQPVEFPVDPNTKPTTASVRPMPVSDPPTRPLTKKPMDMPTAAVPVVAAGAVAAASSAPDADTRSVNQLLKEIDFGVGSLETTPASVAATPTPVIDRRTPLPDSEPATSPESRKPPTPLPATPQMAELAPPSTPATPAQSELPPDLRMDDFEFEFGSLSTQQTGSQSVELPPLELKSAGVAQKGLGPVSRIDQSEPVTEPPSVSTVSNILSTQISKDERLDTMRTPSAGDAPTFDLDSRPSTSQLFELPPLEMKLVPPAPQGAAQRLPTGIDRSEPVTEPVSSLSSLLDDESLLNQTASIGGKLPADAVPTHKFEFADVAKELDQHAGEMSLKLDQDLNDFDDRTIEFAQVEPQRQEGAGLGSGSDYIETKLDLATAYLDMGDQVGARNLLAEVLKEGDLSQKERATELLKKV